MLFRLEKDRENRLVGRNQSSPLLIVVMDEVPDRRNMIAQVFITGQFRFLAQLDEMREQISSSLEKAKEQLIRSATSECKVSADSLTVLNDRCLIYFQYCHKCAMLEFPND